MESIFIKGTKRTPEISLKLNGFMSINGISIPEDATEFYRATMEWLDKYEKIGPENINLRINFVYINTTSTSMMLRILKKIFSVCSIKENLKIIWTYEQDDSDMYEQGKVLEKLVGHSFEFEQVDSLDED
ncbi:MAG: SiaC family regulatory phosphoprotein [Bacteroidota bacterium]|nr:SiaC family regulatory phosphoprotein [Bacteroidota bacterium]